MASAPGTGDFEALARQYWNAWGDAMRHGQASGAGAAGAPGWQEAVDWWSRLAQGGNAQADDVVQRFNVQARDWYGAMQQLAARFSGQPAAAADVAEEWKRALGAMGDNPFPEMFKAMRGEGAQGLDQWIDGAKPYLESIRSQRDSWLGIPAFGLGREQQEDIQALVRAQLDYEQCNAAYNALMLRAVQRAHAVFADKLIEHEEPGRQLTSARALFDLWIDAAEEAYAEIALSREFREVYGALVNSQMRLRQGVQRQVERANAMLGMPTRTEVDGAHRKIAELERVVRRLRDAIGASGSGKSGQSPPAPVKLVAPATRKATPSKTTPKKATPKKSAPRKAAPRKAMPKKATPSKSATRKPAAAQARSRKAAPAKAVTKPGRSKKSAGKSMKKGAR